MDEKNQIGSCDVGLRLRTTGRVANLRCDLSTWLDASAFNSLCQCAWRLAHDGRVFSDNLTSRDCSGRSWEARGEPEMQAHEMDVIIQEDHRVVVELPPEIRSGPARMILLIPSEGETAAEEPRPPEARGRMAALHAELAADPRTFWELSPEERRARLQRVRGIGRGLLSTSEEFARRKREEIELEERKFAH